MVSRDLTGHVMKREGYPFAYGGSADIWKGCWDYDSGSIEVAVKVIKGIQPETLQHISSIAQRLIRETRVLATLNHPNISPCYGISFDFDRPNMPCLVSPYYRNGNISRYLKEHPSINKLPLIAQIADAVSYMHRMSVIHGDIKGANILINDKGEANLSDFGLARILQTSDSTTRISSGGSNTVTPNLVPLWEDEESIPATTEAWRWRAPELIETRVDEQEEIICRVTTATDVYAFAMTAFEIFTGCIPFSHIRNDAKVVLTIVEGGRPKRMHCPQISDDIWRMLERCWDAEPNRRPSMATLLHFFKLLATSRTPHSARL